ncbi:FxLYD domain-containing protein [Bacillus sp. BAU-SS-2023]|nr:FxLYD domain-containing protein [Bacillus sp. BAU-SS-2023]
MLKKLALIGLICLGLVGCSNVKEDKSKVTMEDTTNATEESSGKVEMYDSNLEYVSSKVERTEDGTFESKFIIKNNTNDTIKDLDLTINELDKDGNIVDTASASASTKIKTGQSITLTGTHDKEEIKSLELVSFTYYDSKGEYIEGDFPEGITVNMK